MFWSWQHTGNWGFVTILTIFLWQFWSWQHTGSGLVTGTYGGYWTQCGNTMGSTPRTLLHWNNIKNVHLVSWFYIFVHYFTFSSLFLHENTAKWVLATDFTTQIHLRKNSWHCCCTEQHLFLIRPGLEKGAKKFCLQSKRLKVLFTIKALKHFLFFSVPCVCSVKSTRSCIFRQFTK